MRRARGNIVESGNVLDVVIRSAVKAVEAMASAGTRDMLRRMCYELPGARSKRQTRGRKQEREQEQSKKQ